MKLYININIDVYFRDHSWLYKCINSEVKRYSVIEDYIDMLTIRNR
jgi:hypothetical protein